MAIIRKTVAEETLSSMNTDEIKYDIVVGKRESDIAICQPRARTAWRELSYCSSEVARAFIPYELASRLGVLPLALHQTALGTFLSAVFAGEASFARMNELRFAAGIDVAAEAGDETAVRAAIHAAYRGQQEALKEAVVKASAVEQIRPEDPAGPASSNQPIPRLLEAILDRAVYLDASDIHIEPKGDGASIRFRVHGLLQQEKECELDVRAAGALTRRIKVLARLDTTVVDEVQEGAFTYKHKDRSWRLRVSFLPQCAAEKIVLRVLENPLLDNLAGTGRNRLASLGITGINEAIFRAHLFADRGTLLLSGPTGSGKTTLLYAALCELNKDFRNIITLEDPVEKQLPGINQTDVDFRKGRSFAELLPKLLRQDPDVIMIGEIRDRATAETALTASITGSLVLSTVHAGNCLEIFPRLVQLGVQPMLIASALRLVVAQRLVARNCPYCCASEQASPALRRLFNLEKSTQAISGKGCARCKGTGTSGRTAVFELLQLNEAMRTLVADLAASDTRNTAAVLRGLHEQALKSGYKSYLFEIREKLLNGEISSASALRAAGLAPEAAQ